MYKNQILDGLFYHPVPKKIHRLVVWHTSLEVVVNGDRVGEQVLGLIDSASTTESVHDGANERLASSLVTASIPPHTTPQSLGLDVRSLRGGNIRSVVADEDLLARVITVCSNGLAEFGDGSTGLGKSLVIPDAVLPRSRSDTVVRLAKTGGGRERSSVERHAQNDFVGSNAILSVVGDGLVSVERSASGVVG